MSRATLDPILAPAAADLCEDVAGALRELARRAAVEADAGGAPRLVEFSQPLPYADPLAWLELAGSGSLVCEGVQLSVPGAPASAAALGAARAWLGHPGEGALAASELACVGETLRLEGRCLADVQARAERLIDEARLAHGQPPRWAAPRWLAGAAFDAEAGQQAPLGAEGWSAFPPALLLRPAISLAAPTGGPLAWLTVGAVALPGEPGERVAARLAARLQLALGWARAARAARPRPAPASGVPLPVEPDDARYLASVDAALAAIEAGELEKVVVARRREHPSALAPEALARRLRARFPDCLVYLIAPAGAGPALVGASPELLARRRGDALESWALAGSRSRGADAAGDEAAAAELLASDKDRREHDLVVRAIARALRSLGAEVTQPAAPTPRRLSNVIHLASQLRAQLAPERPASLGAVARALHPTPALAGTPRPAALAFIREHEPDRGWYGGPLGWIDDAGDGELWVAIRAALLARERPVATLFAGGGIVAGSQPASELEETCVKLDAVGRLL